MTEYTKHNNNAYNYNNILDYSIVMTYFKRHAQLNETLCSFNQYKNEKIEVIIINDGPDDDLITLINNFNYPILLIQINLKTKNYFNPCIPFNIGFKYIQSPITIIQNAECLHYNNIITSAKIYDLNESYQVFSCYSLSKYDTHLYQQNKVLEFNNIGANNDGESAWYNHGTFRPSGYHFCSMISTNNLLTLNGFDERYKFGIGFDDDEFLYRIKNSNFLTLVFNDDGIALHQWHYSSGNIKNSSLVNRNRFLFAFITKRKLNYNLFLLFNNIQILNRSIFDYFFILKDKLF